MTLAWDGMPAASLDGTIATLAAHGFAPQIVVEDSETQRFRERFADERDPRGSIGGNRRS